LKLQAADPGHVVHAQLHKGCTEDARVPSLWEYRQFSKAAGWCDASLHLLPAQNVSPEVRRQDAAKLGLGMPKWRALGLCMPTCSTAPLYHWKQPRGRCCQPGRAHPCRMRSQKTHRQEAGLEVCMGQGADDRNVQWQL